MIGLGLSPFNTKFVSHGMPSLLSGLLWGSQFNGNANDVLGVQNGTSTNVVYSSGNGVINQGAGLDGTAYVTLGTGITTTTTFSLSIWLYPTSTAGSYASIAVTGGGSVGLYFNPTTNKMNYYYSGDHASSTSLTQNAWNHVCITVNAGSLTFYLNGVANGTSTSVPSALITRFGRHTGGEAFTGNLDEPYYWNRVITAAEISYLASIKTYPFA